MTKLTEEEIAVFDGFCAMMRANLEANAHKGGWSKDQSEALLARVKEELAELEEELSRGPSKAIPARIVSEAADVALMIMMVADVATRDRKGRPLLPIVVRLSPPEMGK